MKAKDIMKKHVIHAEATMTLREALLVLHHHDITDLAVTDHEGKFIGMVYYHDIVYHGKKMSQSASINLLEDFLYESNAQAFQEEFLGFMEKPLSELIRKSVISIKKDMPFGEVVHVMEENHLSSIPVVDKDVLLGIVGRREVLWGLRQFIG